MVIFILPHIFKILIDIDICHALLTEKITLKTTHSLAGELIFFFLISNVSSTT